MVLRTFRLNMMTILVSALIIGQTSCRTTSSRDSAEDFGGSENNKDITPSNTGTITIDPASRGLANGWDSELQQKLAPCLESDFYYRGAQAADLTIMRDLTYDQILKETGAGIYGQASLFGLASAKVQGDMAMALASTDDSTSFIYNFSLLGKSAVLRDRRFNTQGSSAFHKNDLSFFKQQCGDQFVEQVKLGGQLYIGVKYTFASKETKQNFSLKISLSLFWGLIKTSKTWSKETRDMMKDVRISIEAFQVGGNPQKLQDLKDQIYKGSCAGDEPEQCAEAVERLVNYGANDFKEQLADLALSQEPNVGPAIVDIGLQDYKSLKIYDAKTDKNVQVNVTVSSTPENDLTRTLENLNRLKVNLGISQGRIKILKEFNLSETDRSTVDEASQLINEAYGLVTNLLETSCFKAKTEASYRSICLEKAKEIEAKATKAIVPVALKSDKN